MPKPDSVLHATPSLEGGASASEGWVAWATHSTGYDDGHFSQLIPKFEQLARVMRDKAEGCSPALCAELLADTIGRLPAPQRTGFVHGASALLLSSYRGARQ